MDVSEAVVGIFENNKTRAELYALWLDAYDVRVASSKQTAQKHVGDELAVAVVNEKFADGAAETLVEILRSESQLCRVLAIKPRSGVFPEFDSESSLKKPVFEEELQEQVERLLYRRNLHRTLRLYYQKRVQLIASEKKSSSESREIQELRETAVALQSTVEQYRERLSDDDVAAVMSTLSLGDDQSEPEEENDSKYLPDRCPSCKREWRDSEDRAPVKRIAAYTWRCKECGNVIMNQDPSRQQTRIYRQ